MRTEKESRPSSAKTRTGNTQKKTSGALNYSSVRLMLINDLRSGSVMLAQKPSAATLKILEYAAHVARQADANGFRPYELLLSSRDGFYVFGGEDHGFRQQLEPSEDLDAAKKLMSALGLTLLTVTLLEGDAECYVTFGHGVSADPDYVAIFEY